MGTRGLFGFFFRGKFYVVYNHFDSYPSGLGVALLQELIAAIEANRLDEWRCKLESIRVVSEDDETSEEDVGWYEKLHECQGSFERVLASGYLLNALDRAGEPQWQEYAYVVNFDEQTFDFYAETKHVMSHKLEKERLAHLLHAFRVSR